MKLKGRQEPSARIVPNNLYSDGADATKILHAGKIRLDEWQANILEDWMGHVEEDVWAAPTCGLSVPRQNGKTLDTAGRIVAGMILYGEWCVYTSHLQKTSTETFMELKSIFESPKLLTRVAEIKSAIGREQIFLKNGGRVVFVARTRNGGRGLHGDLLVFDEAQELTSEQQASFLPAISASRNPQTIYLGTPPTPESDGRVFRNIRQKALDGKTTDVSWTEFSVDKIGDVTDRGRWALANPALGRRIRESTVASECAQMDPDTFARERLGWWSPVVEDRIDYALDKKAWAFCKSDQVRPEGKTAYGIKFTPDGAEVVLCGAVCPKEGPARVEQIERRSTGQGIGWLSDWLNARYKAACCVVIDGRNGVDLLCDRIKDTWKAKGSVVRPSAKEVIAAASQMITEVNEKTVTWYAQQEDLNDSATTSVKRSISGGFGFGGENSVPIEAAALALWGCRTTKRDPSRKMRIG